MIKDSQLIMGKTTYLNLLLIWFMFSVPVTSETLKGYYFKDNLLDMRFGPENGYADYETGIPIPDSVSNNITIFRSRYTPLLD